MKQKLLTIFLTCIFLIGVSLLLYPVVSDLWNAKHQSRIIASYQTEVETMDHSRYQELWGAAEAYNQALQQRGSLAMPDDTQRADYDALLNVGGTGIMGYIEIPSINVKLPIFHGTDQAVLQVAVGHLEWSSLPVGGAGTHSVLSGHRGLPSATLLTHLDQMAEGDLFHIHVLDQVLTYQVDQISIVEPENVQALQPEEGKDLVTLVTCTPYGINSHRLLVRGQRMDAAQETKTHVIADAVMVNSNLVAAAVAAPLVLVLAALVIIPKYKKK